MSHEMPIRSKIECLLQCNLAVSARLYGIKKLHQREDNVKSDLLILGLLRNLRESKKKKVGLYLFNMSQSFIKRIKIFLLKIITVPSNNKQKSDHVSMSGFCLRIAIDCFEKTIHVVLANYLMRKPSHQLLLMQSI